MALISIDEKIEQQKLVVSRTKDQYDAVVADLGKLMSKRDEIKKELLDTITVRHMSCDEIIAMIKDADQQKSDPSDVESLLFRKLTMIP